MTLEVGTTFAAFHMMMQSLKAVYRRKHYFSTWSQHYHISNTCETTNQKLNALVRV